MTAGVEVAGRIPPLFELAAVVGEMPDLLLAVGRPFIRLPVTAAAEEVATTGAFVAVDVTVVLVVPVVLTAGDDGDVTACGILERTGARFEMGRPAALFDRSGRLGSLPLLGVNRSQG